jgi:hypothetical protein
MREWPGGGQAKGIREEGAGGRHAAEDIGFYRGSSSRGQKVLHAPCRTHLDIQDAERGRGGGHGGGEACGSSVAHVVLADVEHRERAVVLRGSALHRTLSAASVRL